MATTALKPVAEAVTKYTKANSITRFGLVPTPKKGLPKDKRTRLPIPPTNIITRQYAPSRFEDHYYNTLQDDVMYMTYVHERGPRPPPRQIRLRFDPEDPYSKYRKNPPVGGSHLGRQPPPPSSPENVTKLEKIQIHTMIKQAMMSKSEVLGVMMALRALSGETENGGGGKHTVEGVQIVKGKKQVGGWLRPGIPIGAKVTMKGQNMYDFIGTLVEFVLPRLREFDGLALPIAGSNVNKPSSVSGVVSMGLPPEAMGFFPQIEVNQEAYPRQYGMHIHFITNAQGVGAQDRARALVSGFQIPFVRTVRQ
ncbi:60s ribosomal protein l7 [Armillaria luteobubalina]|uniref:60s ribosomal protein l7 n=1 Tax=Armillaria luteobubalina TaxID=153913 RepID=A0AA39UDJ5_9AGAR|nr:60s ribosomal protein l7 [Armillaria luteobubalina]